MIKADKAYKKIQKIQKKGLQDLKKLTIKEISKQIAKAIKSGYASTSYFIANKYVYDLIPEIIDYLKEIGYAINFEDFNDRIIISWRKIGQK